MLLTPKQNALLHVAQSTAVAGLVIFLYIKHRIPLDATCLSLAGLGGVWSAVGGVLKLSGGGIAATPPAPSTPVASAPPAAGVVPPVVPAPVPPAVVAPGAPITNQMDSPQGANLGPEHGAPA